MIKSAQVEEERVFGGTGILRLALDDVGGLKTEWSNVKDRISGLIEYVGTYLFRNCIDRGLEMGSKVERSDARVDDSHVSSAVHLEIRVHDACGMYVMFN